MSREGQPRRVMHFADIINRYDFIDNVVRNVAGEEFQTSVATYVAKANIESPNYEQDGIPVHVLGTYSRRDYPASARRLAALLRQHRIDILHAHHFEPACVGWAATRLHSSTRLVVGRHYSDDHHAYLSGLKRWGVLSTESLVYSGAALIVVPSRMIRDILVERQGVPSRKVEIIPYPFDPAHYDVPSAAERAAIRTGLGIDQRFAVATAARLLPKKGHRFLVRAVQQIAGELHDLVWLIVGDGPERSRLQQLVRDSGIDDRVRFLGWRTDALRILSAVDVVAQPTLQEGYSQVMVEALWMGTPLVMTDVSGASDLIVDGHTGLLVPRADAGALAAALRMLHDNRELGRRLAVNARAKVEAELTLRTVIPRFADAYRAVGG